MKVKIIPLHNIQRFWKINRAFLKGTEVKRRIVKKNRSVWVVERREEGAERERSVNEGKSLSVVGKRGAAAGRRGH